MLGRQSTTRRRHGNIKELHESNSGSNRGYSRKKKSGGGGMCKSQSQTLPLHFPLLLPGYRLMSVCLHLVRIPPLVENLPLPCTTPTISTL